MFNLQQKMGNAHSHNKPRCPAYRAYFRLSPERKVRIFFLKRHLPSEVMQLQFGKGQFEMPFMYELPPVVLLKLGIESYKIQPGTYPIMESPEYIRVDF